MKNLNYIDLIALILLIVGGLNWGSIGLFSVDLVAAIFGVLTVAARTVYALVGLSALYVIYYLMRVYSKNILPG
ncbi:MAG: DUF378 domain-containing protein [Gammaproteobacteria bacterium]